MPRAGPRKVQRYSLEFKLKAVKLSQLKGVEVQAVAEALEIHPFMLSRWRKEARDGVLRGRVSLPSTVKKTPPPREMKRFQTSGGTTRRGATRSGWVTSRTSPSPSDGGISPWCWINTPGACWPGGWQRRGMRCSPAPWCTQRSGAAAHRPA